MNRIKTYIYACIVLLGVLASGCRQEESLGASLEVSARDVTFDAQSSQQTIDIKTNQGDWHFVVGARWLECTKEGNRLVLNALPNVTGQTRHASIAITAGKLVEHVDVVQKADASGLATTQGEYNLAQWEEKMVIPIQSSSSSWQVKVSEPWVQVRPNVVKGEIVVHVDENDLRSERSAFILVEDRSTAASISISIKQQGILWFILPSFSFGEGMEPIKTFEFERRSTLRPTPTTQGDEETWAFDTYSPVFPLIDYTLKQGKLIRSTVYMPISVLNDQEDGLLEFLSQNGFAEEGNRFVNKTLGVSVRYGRSATSENDIAFMFEPMPVQPAPQPTFTTFPLYFASQEEWYKKKEADITAWTTQNGFDHSAALSQEDQAKKTKKLTYIPRDNEHVLSQMAFYLSTNEVDKDAPINNIFMTYQDKPELLSKFFWEKEGQYHLTDEFVALARSAGFSYLNKSNTGLHIFENEETSTLFGVKVVVPSAGSSLKPFVLTQIEYSN